MNLPFRGVHLVLALILMTLLLTSCNRTPNPSAGTTAARSAADESPLRNSHAGHANAPEPAAPAATFSIYDLESEWQDQQARSLVLGDLAGRPRVITMVYTSCAYACPRILKDMKRIEGELHRAGISAGFVMVSIDPERDTPDRLRDYAASTLLDPADWTLLTGAPDGVLELAALLGVRYRRTSETDFEHSNVITLVDAEGRIVHRQVGLNAEPDALVQAAFGL